MIVDFLIVFLCNAIPTERKAQDRQTQRETLAPETHCPYLLIPLCPSVSPFLLKLIRKEYTQTEREAERGSLIGSNQISIQFLYASVSSCLLSLINRQYTDREGSRERISDRF